MRKLTRIEYGVLAAAILIGAASPSIAQTVREGSSDGHTTRRADPQDRRITRPAEDGVQRAPGKFRSRRTGSDPVQVRDPGRAVVLIFNHGTRRPQYRHACSRDRDIPGVVREIAGRNGWRVHYLCSTAIDGGVAGSYTYKRAAEIERTVDAYRRLGVPASRIFLVGQSAGAWSSLIAARRFGAKFNALIAFAPAFAGPRHEAARYPRWRGEIRPRQVNDILKAEQINALVFAFPDDSFNRPRELAFLRRLAGVRLVPFTACMRGHGTAYTACFSGRAGRMIEAFVRERVRRPS